MKTIIKSQSQKVFRWLNPQRGQQTIWEKSIYSSQSSRVTYYMNYVYDLLQHLQILFLILMFLFQIMFFEDWNY